LVLISALEPTGSLADISGPRAYKGCDKKKYLAQEEISGN
jgi:hypothetical protein